MLSRARDGSDKQKEPCRGPRATGMAELNQHPDGIISCRWQTEGSEDSSAKGRWPELSVARPGPTLVIS
jgi:hypothetical protein